jgi:hypothetical protein
MMDLKLKWMIMFSTLSILLAPIGIGIALDLIVNGGDSLANIFSSIRGKENDVEIEYDEKLSLVKKLITEIDDLRDDLEYDNTPEQVSMIHAKIADRQRIIDKLI